MVERCAVSMPWQTARASRILTGGAEKMQGTDIQGENGIKNLFFDALTVKINLSDDNQTELLDFIKFFLIIVI